MIGALALSLLLLLYPAERIKTVDLGSVIEVAGYCSAPEPLRLAVVASLEGPPDRQDATSRGIRFIDAMSEYMTIPEVHSGLPLCSRLPQPAPAIALFQVLPPVAISPTDEVQFWAGWWADAGGRLYMTVVAPRSDA